MRFVAFPARSFFDLVGISKRQVYLQGFENLAEGNKTFEIQLINNCIQLQLIKKMKFANLR